MAKGKATGSQKKYKNTGVTTLVFEGVEMEPGSEFEATLDPDHELQLLTGGHLEILQDQSSRADRAQAEAAEGGTIETDSSNAPSRRRNR